MSSVNQETDEIMAPLSPYLSGAAYNRVYEIVDVLRTNQLLKKLVAALLQGFTDLVDARDGSSEVTLEAQTLEEANEIMTPVLEKLTITEHDELARIFKLLGSEDEAKKLVVLIWQIIDSTVRRIVFPVMRVIDSGKEHPGSIEFRKRWDDMHLADELIARLNAMINATPEVGSLLGVLLQKLVVVGDPFGYINHHPTIQTYAPGEKAPGDDDEIPVCAAGVTPIGWLNGIVGTIQEGDREGWGYIEAVREDDGRISRFERSDLSKSTDKGEK